MEPLAREAIRCVKDGETKFVPERFTKNYMNWMENLHDWCISRQLWWGHQIPVWYCADCGHMTCTREDACACEKCGSTNIDRLQRITGYLVGTTDRWNKAKLAELNDRIVHD
jgi:valyl-tRNA synthetase